MKAEKIKKLLKGVMDNLIKSIKDDEIKNILEKDSFITGGCIPSMLLDEYINDFDIYLTSKDAVDRVLRYYRKNYNEDEGKLLKDEKKFEPKLITDNAINLTDKIQIITRFYGEPLDVVSNFDWKHIKSYYEYPDKLHLENDIYKLIVEKDLIYTGSEYPLSSLLRTKKFIRKGWNISNNTMINIALDICNVLIKTSKLEDSNGTLLAEPEEFENNLHYKISVDELVDQMNGVDPLIIQNKLRDVGEYLTIGEIIEKLRF